MNTIIEKIRAEIERLQHTDIPHTEEWWDGADYVRRRMKEFLSDLEKSEKPSEGLEEEVKAWHKKHFKSKKVWEYYSGYYLTRNSELNLARHFYELGQQSKPKVCDGLEEEIRSYFMTNRIVNHSEMGWERWGEQIARHFAQWGAEHCLKSEFLSKFAEMTGSIDTMPKNTLPPSKECEKGLREPLVPTDLEEAAKNYAMRDKCMYEHFGDVVMKAVFFGAKWQKEQDEKEQADLFTIVALDAAQRAREQMMIQWTGNNLKDLIEFTGKSPRFNEWFKSWDDYEDYVRQHGNIFKMFNDDGSHLEVPVGAWIVKTPDKRCVASKFTLKQPESEKIAAAYQLGLADKEKQMLKEAVEGEFCNTPFPTICLDDCKDYNFKDNQKVRIIIVKED